MGNNLAVLAVGVIVGLFIAAIILVQWYKKVYEETADVIIMQLQEQFDYAKELGAKSGIDHTMDKKGLQYSVYYYGRIVNVLKLLKPKNAYICNIEQNLETFLSAAIEKDYHEKVNDPKAHQTKMDALSSEVGKRYRERHSEEKKGLFKKR